MSRTRTLPIIAFVEFVPPFSKVSRNTYRAFSRGCLVTPRIERYGITTASTDPSGDASCEVGHECSMKHAIVRCLCKDVQVHHINRH